MDSASGPTYSLCPTAFPLASVLSTRVTGLRRRSREVMRKLYLSQCRIAESLRRRGEEAHNMNESRVLEARLRCSARGGQRSRAARALAAGRREQDSIGKSECEPTFRDLRPVERRLRPARARILKMFRPD